MDRGRKRGHLSVWGVGPAYALLCVLLTAGGLFAWRLGWLTSGDVPGLCVPMRVAGAALLAVAATLFGWAHLRMRLFDRVRQNELVTTGAYAWVRNPVYSAAMLACTGLLLMAHNLWLLLLPPVMWGLMTALLILTEEKWLHGLYGAEYAAYCARVNRCLPWLPRR